MEMMETKQKFERFSDEEMADMMANPRFDIKQILPILTEEEKEKYTTRDGTINYLAYEKDKGILITMSDKAEKEMGRKFKLFMVGFTSFIAIIIAIYVIGAVL